jgi:hypothetical protein
MKKVLKCALSLGVAACTLTLAPLQAQATEQGPTTAGAAMAADGFLHLYRDFNFRGWCGSFARDAANWGSCDNAVSSLHNNGYPGPYEDVWVFEGAGYSGARRGVHVGVFLPDLSGIAYDGTGLSLNNTISSHLWTNF